MTEWVEPWQWIVNEVITAVKLNTYRQCLLHLKEVLDSHRATTPIDHPDGSIPPSKLDATNTPSDGQAPVYDGETGRFRWAPAGEGGLRCATRIVAASNSLDRTRADYVCDGADDQEEINAAIADLGTTGGMVLLLEGTYNITGSIVLASNIALVGQGPGTVLRVPDGFNADLNVISGSNVSGVLVANLKVDGNKANQRAGTMNGIYLSSVTHSEVRSWVENMRDNGIVLDSSSSHNTITGNTCQGNKNSGIYLSSSSYNTVTGNTCQQNDYGIYLSFSGHNTITGNLCQGNYIHGIYLYPSSNNNTIVGNTCQGNGSYGIGLSSSSDNNTIAGNTCQGNAYFGIYLYSSGHNTITGNTCQGNNRHGIVLGSSSNNAIVGNCVLGNSQEADASYDGIYMDYDSNHNLISGNVVRHQGGERQHRYGINIATSDCDGNLIHGNDLYQAGRTGDYNDAGTGTIYHHNRTSEGWVP
jgi:parallel beta-helix repeat protein